MPAHIHFSCSQLSRRPGKLFAQDKWQLRETQVPPTVVFSCTEEAMAKALTNVLERKYLQLCN